MSFLFQLPDGTVLLRLYVQPKASRTKVMGLFDGCLKIAVAAPPVDGKANDAVVRFLAKKLRLSRKNVVLKGGAHSRRKTLVVTSLDMDTIRSRF